MGVKKKKEDSTKLVSKILIVCVCVLFVGLMILSGMGTGWLTIFTSVKSGDTVELDYTVYDSSGNPLLTSDQQIYNQRINSGYGIIFSKPLIVTANKSLAQPLFPVQVYISQSGGSKQFGFLKSEYDTISVAIIGMKSNEQKKINLGAVDPITEILTNDQMKKLNLNLTMVDVGESIVLPISETNRETPNSTPVEYLRIVQIFNKTSEGVILNYNLPSIDVRVVTINNR
jgi:hypothetical protein